MKLYWMTEDSILKQIEQEYLVWYDAVENIRNQKREDLKTFFDSNRDDKKIQVRTVFQAFRMKMAIRYSTRAKAEWTRRRKWDTERAKNANRAWKYDRKEMWLDKTDYLTYESIDKIGVGIQMNGAFNLNTICPTIKNVDALTWIPDPQGWPTIEDHRWFGFDEVYLQMWQMEKLGYENLENATVRDVTVNDWAKDNATGKVTAITDSTYNKEYATYVHGFIRDGKKYIAVTNADRTNLHDLKYLKPVTLEEKKDESLVPFPVMLQYAIYLSGYPLGVSLVDLLADTQSILSRMYNLYLAMAYRNTFGGDRLVRAGELEDPDSLNTPTIEGKDIPVKDTAKSLNDILLEIPREQTNGIPSEMIALLKRNGTEALGAESTQQGVLSDSNKTLGEQEMAQKNANIQFQLEENVMLWGEEFKMKFLWFRQYLANMKSAEQKDISLSEWTTREFYVFKKDDFVGKEILSLEITSASSMTQDKSNKAEKAVILQQMIAGATSEGLKRKYYRMWCEIADFSDNQIEELLGLTGDEIWAEKKLAMVNEGMEEWAIIDSMDDDHNVYISYLQTADPSELKDKALQARYDAIKIKEWQMNGVAGQNGAEQAGASANSAMMTSSMLQWGSQVPSNNG
jgi:hypothetical protein